MLTTNILSFDMKNTVVHEQDFDIIRELCLSDYNAIIAGGAALQWWSDCSINEHDIDVYHSSKKQHELHVSDFLRKGHAITFETQSAITFRVAIGSRRWRVQFIKMWDWETPYKLIDQFDITVCKIATDGNVWIIGENFIQDWQTKTLRVTKFHEKSLRRVIKYWTYGYQPLDDVLLKLSEHPQVSWDYINTTEEDYANDA